MVKVFVTGDQQDGIAWRAGVELVTAPDGTVRVGNQAEDAAPSFDTLNNVELVQVTAPTAGNWSVDVVGSNVTRGPQPFALVVRGQLG